MSKLISIIMPTYNRVGYLEYTLGLLSSQIKRNADKVELIICNNASTDSTEIFLSELHTKDPYFQYINYTDHVDIGNSIKRSIDNANGKYVLMWSDDDIPNPLLIDLLLMCVVQHPDLACIHFNGMDGIDDDNYGVRDVNVKNKIVIGENKIFDNFLDFAEKFWLSMGIMSSDLFLKSAWDKGCQLIDTSEHYGWNFLVPILCGIKGGKCMYLNFPLWIQRAPKYRAWQSRAAYYWFVGIPNLLVDLEKNGIIRNFDDIWNNKINSISLVLHLGTQMVLDKQFYKKNKGQIMYYQKKKPIHRIVLNIILYCLPSSLYKFLRAHHFQKNTNVAINN